jgi:hypothetical protein
VDEFRNVGMIGIVNEPEQNQTQVKSMINDYYPEAYSVSSILFVFKQQMLMTFMTGYPWSGVRIERLSSRLSPRSSYE